MAILKFNHGNFNDLYVTACATGQTVQVLYLLKKPNPSAPSELEFSKDTLYLQKDSDSPESARGSAKNDVFPGYFVFVNEAIQDEAHFVQSLRTYLGKSEIANARFVWVADPNAETLSTDNLIEVIKQTGGGFTTIGAAVFKLYDLSLVLRPSIAITATDDGIITFTQARNDTDIFMAWRMGSQRKYVGKTLTLPLCNLAAQQAGTMGYSLVFDRDDLQEFGVEIRYFQKNVANPSEGLIISSYPLFYLEEAGPRGGKEGQSKLTFNASIDPNGPTDIERTYFAFAAADAALAADAQPIQSFFRTNLGEVLWLKPKTGARLVLSPVVAPAGSNLNDSYYFTPNGNFELLLTADNNPQLEAESNTASKNLICGMSGTEYATFNTTTKDMINFVAHQAAYAPPKEDADATFPDDDHTNGVLATNYMTSWVNVGSEESNGRFNQYYAQPDDAPLFTHGTQSVSPEAATEDETTPVNFLDAFPGQFANLPATTTSKAFPMVPYGGLDQLDEEQVLAYKGLESIVISPARKHVINKIRDKNAIEPLAGEAPNPTATPQGLLGQFSNGSWSSLKLAKDADANHLQFSDITDDFGQALQSAKLFMVVSKKEVLGTFANNSSIGGWPFQIDLGEDENGSDDWCAENFNNILIFKFNDKKSIEELANDTTVWATGFNADDSKVQTCLQAFIADIKTKYADKNTLYTTIHNALTNERWNGILALNVKIPLDKLPKDIRGLVGGIKKLDQFKANHFGININKIADVESISLSSLFALIDYEDDDKYTPPADGKYDFTVRLLQVLFDNSEIKDFHGKVDLVINDLFNEKTSLEDAASGDKKDTAKQENDDETKALVKKEDDADEEKNKITLTGSYEDHNGTQTYTFTYEGNKVFKLAGEDSKKSIIETVSFKKVQFATTSTTPAGSNITAIESAFSFWGKIKFGDFLDFDFFSFDDLVFAGLKIGQSFKINTITNRTVPNSIGFIFDPGNLRFDVSFSKARQDSLLGNFPLKLNSFTYATEGFKVADLDYLSVPNLVPGVPSTDTPYFGLGFSLSLGSPGALTSDNGGFAIDILAAWAPTSATGGFGLAFGIKLPKSSGGKKEIGIEGVLTLSMEDFGFNKLAVKENEDVSFDKQTKDDGTFIYSLFLTKSVLRVLGMRIPPGDLTFSLLLFVPQSKSGSGVDLSNLGWFVAISEDKKEGEDGDEGSETAEAVIVPVAPLPETAAEGEGDEGEGEEGEGGDGEKGSTVLKLAYLGLGQRIQIPGEIEDLGTVEEVLEKMGTMVPANLEGEELIKQLTETYNKDAGWLIGADITLFDTVRLGVVFAEGQSLYGLLIGLYKPESFKGFQFQILYKKISDTIGVYQILISPPDALRQLQFGAFSISLPNIGFDIYTNSDFKVDFGFPKDNDFSKSFGVQAMAGPIPVLGYAGFYFAKLSSATSKDVPATTHGVFSPVLEVGFGISVGVGKTINKGILKAGATITFQGIFEGLVAYYTEGGGQSVAVVFDKAPDYMMARATVSVVGHLYGSIDFGIISAGVDAKLWATIGVQFETYGKLELWIEAGISLSVHIKIVFVTISLSFSTHIRFSFKMDAFPSPPAPWAQPVGPQAMAVLEAESTPAEISWEPTPVFQTKQHLALYYAAQMTAAQDTNGQQQAQSVTTLVVETASDPQTAAPFEIMLHGLIAWTIRQAIEPNSDNPFEIKINDSKALHSIILRLDMPKTLARTTDGYPLTYYDENGKPGPLQEFLIMNFDVTLAAMDALHPSNNSASSNNGQVKAALFPVIPDTAVVTSGQSGDPIIREFWKIALRDDNYQDDLADYFAKLMVNFEQQQAIEAQALAEPGKISIATTMFQDYFALLIKQGITAAEQYMYDNDLENITVSTLLDDLHKSGKLTDIGAMASRFMQFGLRIPTEFPATAANIVPLYALDGQQFPILLNADEDYSITMHSNVAWVVEDAAHPPVMVITQDNSSLRQQIKNYESIKLNIDDLVIDQLNPLVSSAKQFTLKNPQAWTNGTGDKWSIWPYPDNLLHQLQIEENAQQPSLDLQLFTGAAGIPYKSQGSPASVTYQPALQITVNVRLIPQNSSGNPLPNIYQIGGTNEAVRNLIDNLLEQLNKGIALTLEQIHVLYAADGTDGLVSDTIDPTKILLMRTNLSTESAPGDQVSPFAVTDQPPADDFAAYMNQIPQFLQLLWEVSIVNGGGYYLYYENDKKKGLPDKLFAANGSAELTFMVACTPANGENENPVGTYTNVLFVTKGDPSASKGSTFYASAADIVVYNPKIAPGSHGFSVQRPNPDPENAPLMVPDMLREIIHAHAERLDQSGRFNQLMSEVVDGRPTVTRAELFQTMHQIGIPPGHPQYYAILSAAIDDKTELLNLFNLLSYQIVGDDNFCQSDWGLPVGPSPADKDDNILAQDDPGFTDAPKWHYDKVLPLAAYATAKQEDKCKEDIDGRITNPYAGIGQTATVAFQFLDLFGNEIPSQTALTHTLTNNYTDPILGIDSWPGVDIDYIFTKDGKLQVNARFSGAGFGTASGCSADELQPDTQKVANVLSTYQLILYQLQDNNMQFDLQTSLTPNANTEETTISNAKLVKFVQDIQAALQAWHGCTTTVPMVPSSGVRTLAERAISKADRDKQTENIFEITATLVFERTNFVDADTSKNFPAAKIIETELAPHAGTNTPASNNGKGPQMTLHEFAFCFEIAFPEMKTATGLGTLGGKSIFAIRMNDNPASTQGITFKFAGFDDYLYYAPIPLMNDLYSRRVAVFPNGPAPDGTSVDTLFTDVDMDEWGRAFLTAVDTFLDAEFAVSARQIDAEKVKNILAAKQIIATGFSKGVVNVLNNTQAVPSDAQLQAAREAMHQQMLVLLSNAYMIDTVVQSPVKTTNSNPGGGSEPPNLYGSVTGVKPAAPTAFADMNQKPDYAFSTSKVALKSATGNNNSLLTFVFTTRRAEDQSHVELDIKYQITHVEYNIVSGKGPKGDYNESSWLTLLLPEAPEKVGKADIPVALRDYPVPPTLLGQTAVADQTNEDNPLRNASDWNYTYTYSQQVVAQDIVKSNIQFNVPDSAMPFDVSLDLFDWLARFTAEYPNLKTQLQFVLEGPQGKNVARAKAAIAWLEELVSGAAGVWEGWIDYRLISSKATLKDDAKRLSPSESDANADKPQLGPYEFDYVIKEYGAENDTVQRTIEITRRPPKPNQPEAKFPDVELTIDDKSQTLAPTASGNTAVYKFTDDKQAGTRTRKFILKDFNVLTTENAWGGIKLSRNEDLYPGLPLPDIATNPLFVYNTPLVRFVNKVTPFLDSDELIDISAFNTSDQTTLDAYLQGLFDELFGTQPDTVRNIQMTVKYGFDIRGIGADKDKWRCAADNETALPTLLPVVMNPIHEFTPGKDSSLCADTPGSYVCQLSNTIQSWFKNTNPTLAGGFYQFDLSVYATLSGNLNLPVLRLRGLYLCLGKLT